MISKTRVWFQAEEGCFSSPPCEDIPWPFQLGQWAAEALSSGVNRLERETDQSPLSSANVKNAQSYTFTPPYTVKAKNLVNNFNPQIHINKL
jgi:hypothetical protein